MKNNKNIGKKKFKDNNSLYKRRFLQDLYPNWNKFYRVKMNWSLNKRIFEHKKTLKLVTHQTL